MHHYQNDTYLKKIENIVYYHGKYQSKLSNMANTQEIYDAEYAKFVESIRVKIDDTRPATRDTNDANRSILREACANGCLMTLSFIYDNYKHIFEESRACMIYQACHHNQMHVVVWLLDRYHNFDMKCASNLMRETSPTSAKIRKYILKRFPDAMSYANCLEPYNSLECYPHHSTILDFLVETTKDQAISYRRGCVGDIDHIYVVTDEYIDAPDMIHIDATDFYVYFAPLDFLQIPYTYISTQDMQHVVDKIRLEKLQHALSSAKKSASK